jgi:hypothetical protein
VQSQQAMQKLSSLGAGLGSRSAAAGGFLTFKFPQDSLKGWTAVPALVLPLRDTTSHKPVSLSLLLPFFYQKALVAHASCNPSYSGGRDQDDHGSKSV